MDVAAVTAVLQSDWLTQGPAVPLFEQSLATWSGAAHAYAVSNATSALHLACRALGLGPGDRLWTSPNTFVASANCALYCGASVDFVDIDPLTFNMSIPTLEAKLAHAEATGVLPDILVPVHFAGQPCDMKSIAALSKRYGFRVIEDASHAVGAEYDGSRTGNCAYSDITVFSFHPVKILTTAEGGMLLTQQPEIAVKLELLRSHGITRDSKLLEDTSAGAWYYEQQDLGYNYRMTDIQAALGTSQAKRLPEFLSRRRTLAARYEKLLTALPVTSQLQHPSTLSAYHLYPIRVQGTETRKTIFDALRGKGIGVNVHYIPVHTQPYYRRLGFTWGDFPAAEAYYREAISLPMFPGLTDAQQDYVVASLAQALE